jgi:hypothetical protein
VRVFSPGERETFERIATALERAADALEPISKLVLEVIAEKRKRDAELFQAHAHIKTPKDFNR